MRLLGNRNNCILGYSFSLGVMVDKEKELKKMQTEINNVQFRIKQFAKKRASKSKKVNAYRYRKMMLLSMRSAASVAQYLIIQSQPMPKNGI